MAMEYSSWWPLSSWISPGAALFLFCNALVGAIVVTSSRGEHGGRAGAAASTRRLCRSASSMVLGRLRSFSIFSGVHVEDSYHLELEAEEEQKPQPAAAEPAIPTAPASAAAAAASATSDESADEVAEMGEDNKTVCLEEAQGPSRQPPSPAVVDAAAAEATAAAAERPATVAESIMQRARACRRELVEEAFEGKAALNARAELFIRQFREDLKLQRLNSILNYTRALRRGAGGAAPAAGE